MASKKLPPAFQSPVGSTLPSTRKEAYAEALKQAERDFRAAQNALDGSAESQQRYAKALADYDALQSMFPFVAGGRGDEEV